MINQVQLQLLWIMCFIVFSRPSSVLFSAGIARSGVLIAMDSVVEQAKKTGKVNVHGFVQAMRDCRQNMVQTDVSIVLFKWLSMDMKKGRCMP